MKFALELQEVYKMIHIIVGYAVKAWKVNTTKKVSSDAFMEKIERIAHASENLFS